MYTKTYTEKIVPVRFRVPSLGFFLSYQLVVSARLTYFILDLIGHVRNFVEQRQTLVHPLLNHMQVRHHLKNERGRVIRVLT